MEITELNQTHKTVVDGLIALVESEIIEAVSKISSGRDDYMQNWHRIDDGLKLAGKLDYFPERKLLELKRRYGSAKMKCMEMIA